MNKKSDLIICIFVITFILTYLLIKFFSYKSEPILLDYASIKATNIVTSIINDSIKNNLYNSKYDNIIQIEKNTEGNIVNLNFDNNQINKLLTVLTNDILKDLTKIEKSDNHMKTSRIYYVPFGIIYDSNILSYIGPKIPFFINYIGSLNDEAKIITNDYGINSSIIQVVISIQLQIQVIMPFKSNIINISKDVIIDSKIIQGQTPNYYAGFQIPSLK